MKEKVIKGTFIVTSLTLVVKILSVIYKMPYQNITGDIGFYIYQQVYPLFAILVSISTYALPLVMSELLILHDHRINYKILLKRFMGIGLLVALVILVCREPLAFLLNDHKLTPLMGVLALVCLLTPVTGIYRGLFNSNPNSIMYVGVSLLIEQVTRVMLTVVILFLFYNQGISNLYQVANLSYLGLVVGMLLSIGYLMIVQKIKKLPIPTGNTIISMKTLILRVFTLIVSASILVLFQLIDSFTITRQLSQFIPFAQAIEKKGIYDRGLPLIQVALFFVAPLIAVYLPHIKGINLKKEYGILFEFIFLLALPATVGLMMVINQVNDLLFKGGTLPMVLEMSLISIIIYALIMALTAFNTKMNQYVTPVLLVGVVFKFVFNYLLINPYFGIMGASLSTLLALSLILISLLVLQRKFIHIDFLNLFKIIFATWIMAGYLYISRGVPILNTLFIRILVGMIVYSLVVFCLNVLHIREYLINYYSNRKHD
jgi:polysaccharide transporter, PST family